jgi:two-component system chemotaxis response regulator CheY
MAAQSTRPSAGGHSFPLDFASISFLIVDDQPFTRRLVRTMLHGFGSREVYESATGAEALELARSTMPNIIITDLIMPDLNGLRFIKMMKAPSAPTSGIPIIVLSGYLTKTATLAINESGADELLVKPVSPKALYEHVSRIVLRKNQANPPVAFVQNQRRRDEIHKKKTGDVALL